MFTVSKSYVNGANWFENSRLIIIIIIKMQHETKTKCHYYITLGNPI